MDIRRIRNFLTVVETGSIARAAQVLHIAQPALSAQVRRMEEEVGCQLLSRSSRGVTPTQAGIEFCRRAQDALAAMEALRAIGRESASSPAGHVVIGVPASTGNMIAVPLLQAARLQYPGVSLGLQESPSVYLGELLLRGRSDISVLFGDDVGPGMHSVPVLEEDLFLVGLPTGAPEIELKQLQGVKLVMPSRPNSVRSLLDRACAASGISLDVVADVSSPHTMVQLARAGIAATVLPWSMLGPSSASQLPMTRIVGPVLTRTIAVATSIGLPQSPALIAIRSLLVELLKGLVASSQWQGARLKASHN